MIKSLFRPRQIVVWLILLGCLILLVSIPQSRSKIKALVTEGTSLAYNITFTVTNPSAQPLGSLRASYAAGPLRVHPTNPRYFTDGTRAVLLTGSHTWANFQDVGASDPPPIFDYNGYLDFLVAHNHNFFRLWTWEQVKGMGSEGDNFWIAPAIYVRTGPGTAWDGKPKFDLNQFNQEYFDRMRARIIAAGERGIYVSVMLFNGFSVGVKDPSDVGNPWLGHPYNANNNINGIDGDLNQDGNGYEIQTLEIPAITSLQEAYVRKIIDTVNDLDNVLYEICNESNQGIAEINWQYHLIDLIHSYEANKPKQHPVGMTVAYPEGDNSSVFDSRAEWISPNNAGGYKDAPPPANGAKVIISDTDHLWGIGGDRIWAWKSFMRGLHPIFMDWYKEPGFNFDDPAAASLRRNLGYILSYANRMNLAAMTPRGDLTSSGYALANPVADSGEYLVYLPTGGSVMIDLSATPRMLTVEWFNPAIGATLDGGTVSGGASRMFTAPFGGDAVLYIH